MVRRKRKDDCINRDLLDQLIKERGAHTALGFTRAEIDTMILDGFAGAFLPWPERQRLLASVREDLRAIA